MAPPAQIAHLFRRTGFAVPQGAFSRYASTDIHDLIDERLDDAGWALSEEEANSRNIDDVEWYTLPGEFLNQMMSPAVSYTHLTLPTIYSV